MRARAYWGAAIVVALAIAGCSGDGSSGGAGGSGGTGGQAAGEACPEGSIKVGAVATLSGPVTFAEVPNAAEATFEEINADGGVNGCEVEYIVGDDKGDPQVASQVARDLVQNQGVTVLAGSASLLDCQVNGAFYQQQQILSVQGLGVDAACWSTPNISPVNVGPFTLSTAMLYFASEQLGDQNICVFFEIIAGTGDAYNQAVEDWTAITGKEPALLDTSLPSQGDYTPYVLRARSEGCDAVLTNTVEPQAIALLRAADQQNITGIDWLFLAPGYTDAVAEAVGGLGLEVYAGTEWEPYSETDSPANQEWRAAMESAGLPLTAFSQGGYEAASVLTTVLSTIDGEITRESVTAALHGMEPIEHPLVGTPYVFGPGETHASNHATKVMKLEDGAWTVQTEDWVVLPETP